MWVVEPGDAGAGACRLRSLVRLSAAARALLAARAPSTCLALGMEVVADGYGKRHVNLARVHGVREEDVALLACTLDLTEDGDDLRFSGQNHIPAGRRPSQAGAGA